MTLTLLERLERTRNRLAGNSHYNYRSWSSCTCGHIYKTAKRHRGLGYKVRFSNDSTYREMLLAIANANFGDFSADTSTYTIAQFLSEKTAESGNRRARAIELLDNAIRAERAECEQARLDVLAQAQSIIDNVEVRETEKV